MIKLLNEEYIKNLRDEDGKPKHIGGEDFIQSVLCLIELFTLQEGFQVKAMGQENWWEVKQMNEKPVDYIIAMLGEIGEGIHSLDFKWWGPSEEDRENFITELVDALHFELSNTAMVFHRNVEILKIDDTQKDDLLRKLFTRFGSLVSNSFGFEGDTPTIAPLTTKDKYNLLKHYIYSSIKNDRILCTDPINFNPDMLQTHDIFMPLYDLIYLAYSWNISFKELRERYITKNALNHIRKLNGYKDGSYIKMWVSLEKGITAEDNTIALELVRKNKDLNMEEIIQLLANYYQENVLVIK